MADKTYKLTATLSTGEEIDCGTFTAPQGPRGSTIIGHITASYIPEVTDEEYLSFESLSGVPAVGDTIIVVWSARNGNSALVTAEVIDVNTSVDGEITIIVNSVTNTRGSTGAQGPQGERGPQGPAGKTKYLHCVSVMVDRISSNKVSAIIPSLNNIRIAHSDLLTTALMSCGGTVPAAGIVSSGGRLNNAVSLSVIDSQLYLVMFTVIDGVIEKAQTRISTSNAIIEDDIV